MTKDNGSSALRSDTHRAPETPVVSGHTPGPWSVFPYYFVTGDGERRRLVGQGPYDTVAEVRQGHDGLDGDVEANARLIAAAPDLLASNIELRDRLRAFVGAVAEMTDCGPDVDAIVRADAAIAKATPAPDSPLGVG